METRHYVVPAAMLALLLVTAAVALATAAGSAGAMVTVSGTPLDEVPASLVVDGHAGGGIGPYRGLGTWVDSYDTDPAYTRGRPPVGPSDPAEMAAAGVRTLFLQASRSDTRATGMTTDPWVLADLLLSAHAAGLDVVAWYLPKWTADDEDLERLLAVHRFEVLGHRFDGLAVDIEWNRGELEEDPAERSRRLVLLSERLRHSSGDAVLGGIVMPPVLTDEINPDFWPGFPWAELAPLYDVWLPMSYWSFRTEEHADPGYYSGRNIDLLRLNLGQPGAVVHGIGGVGADDGHVAGADEPLAGADDMAGFVGSLAEAGAVGGSVYDWATTGPATRVELGRLFAEQGFG